MWKHGFAWSTFVVIVALLMVACAPKPVPPPPAAPATTAPAAPQAPAATPTSQDAAWAKVVEAAKREGKLVSYGFIMTGETGIRMKQAFKGRTGLDVEFITSSGAVLVERIKAERRAGMQVASVQDSAPPNLFQAKMEGLTEAAGHLPELQNREVWKESPILDNEGNILGTGVVLISPWINTKLVKPGEEPKSWRDFLQPRWKGKIGTVDPDMAPGAVYIYYQMVKKHGILDDTYFRELGKSIILYHNNLMVAGAVAKGDVDSAISLTAPLMGPYLEEGLPVKAIDMEEGVIGMLGPGVSLLSRAPHSNAAQVFVNWWFSREGQFTFHEVQGTESIRKDVPNFLSVPARLTPKKVMWMSVEDNMETSRLQRERVLKTLLRGK